MASTEYKDPLATQLYQEKNINLHLLADNNRLHQLAYEDELELIHLKSKIKELEVKLSQNKVVH